MHRDLRRRARSDCVWRRNNHTTAGQTCIIAFWPSGWGTSGEALSSAEHELAEARGEYFAVSLDKRKGQKIGQPAAKGGKGQNLLELSMPIFVEARRDRQPVCGEGEKQSIIDWHLPSHSRILTNIR